MNEGLVAFKAMAVGLGAVLIGASLIPNETGQFDPLRFKRTSTSKVKVSRETNVSTVPVITTSVVAPVLAEDTIIPSNFDINAEMVPTAAAPPSADVGAFRFLCSAGQLRYDDPIVYPGQPGKSHLHQFYGNTSADAHSTTYKLRTEGQSTCMSPLNRSAYWMPAMLDGRGQVVRPDYVAIYYKRWPANDPKCDPSNSEADGICVGLPNGLKFIFGFNMLNPVDIPTGKLHFNCDGPGAVPGHYPDIVSAAKNCPTGARLGAILHAPQCWDGKNLDSPDHRSHVAYQENYYGKCPSTHPYVIPEFTLGAWYTTDDTLDRSGTWEPGKTQTWHLSSDVMPGMPLARPGSTFHADWWGAWDNNVMAMWTDNCINKRLSCAGGDLGNGKRLKMFSGFSFSAEPRKVPMP